VGTSLNPKPTAALYPRAETNKTNTNPSSAFDPFDTEEVEDTPDIEPSTGHSDNTPAPNGPPEDDSSDNYEPVGAGDPTSNTSAPASNQVLRHSTRAPAPRRVFRHIDSYPSFFTSSLFTPGVFEPSTYEEAIASPDAPKWMAAMEEEMAALMANNTWSIIEDVPSYAKPIDTRWVFKVKIDANGSVERYKARLVAKGFKQIEGVDYNEVFAPVSKYTTLRAALSVAATKGYIINQVDVKNAFVQGSLKEEVYINLPSGFTTTKPVRLNKALYGLKQAPRAWHEVLNAKLINLGFKPSSADASLFIKGTSYLVVYVDDILVITPTEAEWHNFEGAFSKAFDIRTFPSVTSYLGIQFFRDATGIKLTHENFIKTLISKYDMEDAKPRTTPMSVHTKLTKDDGTPLDVHKFPYSSLVGALLFLASTTRPDIAFTVSALSRYMATPTIGHWETAKRVLRYLSSTATTGLFFEKCSSFDFKAFCDADYAADVSTRRSTTGFIFLLNGTAISWSSKLQKTVALSTSEAEYMAAAAAIKEALWLKTLFTDLSVPLTGPFNLYVDNQAALKILRNPVTTPRSKHIDVLYHFARERVMSGDIAVSYVESAHNLADVFTKPLPPVKHTACCTGFGML
jgi:histone deacetylase 1/2